ncbi:hypothetical protein H3Z83_07910 [Tenacibaculum sp. S7007]|uniref:Bacterial Pleckstrin homology domain-containing protein n=1 Tax=Tenacibaculum pelagium TaxID=2759527 RepID=A0A839AMX4_9FLAO|nr:hypothetical protein [Tenacibaculum pelagium]MBA6156433.1 hypothetical protein [Tenacibaculum pelagium]
MKVFKEEQRFTQTWLIALLGISIVIPIILITKEYLEKNSSMTTNEFLLTLGGIIVSLSFIFFFKLTTKIDETGIHYQFFPFHFSLRLIKWSEIDKAYVRTYDPISEYGGWGLKGGSLWNKKNGTAINVSGDIGIQLELKNGKRILIGTQKENEAKRVLENYKNKLL